MTERKRGRGTRKIGREKEREEGERKEESKHMWCGRKEREKAANRSLTHLVYRIGRDTFEDLLLMAS